MLSCYTIFRSVFLLAVQTFSKPHAASIRCPAIAIKTDAKISSDETAVFY